MYVKKKIITTSKIFKRHVVVLWHQDKLRYILTFKNVKTVIKRIWLKKSEINVSSKTIFLN